jgi:hypothetical protein
MEKRPAVSADRVTVSSPNIGDPGSEACSADQQVVKKDQEIAKTKTCQGDFSNPLAVVKSLLDMSI